MTIPAEPGSVPPGRLAAVLRRPACRALAALLLVVALGLIFNADGAFFKWATHRDLFRQVSVCGILACGMTLVILGGGIDLSVGSLLGLSAVLVSILTLRSGWPALPAVGVTLLAGAACGAASGGLIARWRIQPFIATLAMMVFARGLAKALSGGQKVSSVIQLADGSYRYGGVPPLFEVLNARFLGTPLAWVTLIFLACVAVCGILLYTLRWGRYLYAVGGQEEAARLSGLPVGLLKLLAYGLGGLFSAVAGICQAAQELQGDPEAGAGYELNAIAIVVIGGTSLQGGRGGIGLTLLGALTIGYLEKILSLNAVGEPGRLMLTGLIVIGAVLFQRGKR